MQRCVIFILGNDKPEIWLIATTIQWMNELHEHKFEVFLLKIQNMLSFFQPTTFAFSHFLQPNQHVLNSKSNISGQTNTLSQFNANSQS